MKIINDFRNDIANIDYNDEMSRHFLFVMKKTRIKLGKCRFKGTFFFNFEYHCNICSDTILIKIK